MLFTVDMSISIELRLFMFLYRRRFFHCLLGLAMGITAILNGVMSTYAGFLVMTVLWAFMEGGFHGQRATPVSEFVEQKYIASTVGYVIGFQGFGNMLGGPMGGKINHVLRKLFTSHSKFYL